jgi:hypothetical protein
LVHAKAGQSSDIPPHRLFAARIFLALLLLIVALSLYVWFGRHRMRIDFDQASGDLVIRSRGLARTRLRRIGLAGFSLVRPDSRRHRLWFGTDRIVIEFADGNIEPIVEVLLLDWSASADADEIADAVFTMACRIRQAPGHVSFRAAIDREEGEQETLKHELIVNGKRLAEVDFGPIDLAQVTQSLVAEGVYFIWSGDPDCSGRFNGVEVEHRGDVVHWSDRDTRRCYTFRFTELQIQEKVEITGVRPTCRPNSPRPRERAA